MIAFFQPLHVSEDDSYLTVPSEDFLDQLNHELKVSGKEDVGYDVVHICSPCYVRFANGEMEPDPDGLNSVRDAFADKYSEAYVQEWDPEEADGQPTGYESSPGHPCEVCGQEDGMFYDRFVTVFVK